MQAIQVLFDHEIFSKQRYGGISRYFANIIKGIKNTSDINYNLGLLFSNNYYLGDFQLKSKSLPSFVPRSKAEKFTLKSNELYSKRLVNKNSFDVFHPTYYNSCYLSRLKKPLVITVHDLIQEKFPEYFWVHDPITYYKRLNIERADKIIAISNATKNELLVHYKVDPAKVSVVYHGVDLEAPVVTSPVTNLPKNYLIYVGDRAGYKNFHRFLIAFKQLTARIPDLHVVLTGGGSLGYGDSEFIQRLQLQAKVRHINATDSELNYLYQKALAFVYPSLNEGFGLPILEAFKAGCPTVLSEIECFKEVAADAAVYFEPYNIEDQVHALETVITDSALREKLIKDGAKRLQQFSLVKSVEQTLNVYRSLN